MAITKKVFKVEGMDCASCAMMIDDVLEEMPGVLKSSTNYARAETEVEFEEEKLGTSDLVTAIQNGGYTVLQD